MRILWVCNIMLPVIARHLQKEESNKEGWLSGLLYALLNGQEENQIALGIAFPVERKMRNYQETVRFYDRADCVCYGFYEDMGRAERYGPTLEKRMREIVSDFAPDVVHCFGTEYGHSLAAARTCGRAERLLVGIQGLCAPYAKAYRADLPEKAWEASTFRDWLKKDGLAEQRGKFEERGEREREVIRQAGNVTGRTRWDRFYVEKWNPRVSYYKMNEILREEFYKGEWDAGTCRRHSIFISQGDYPIKGLHYMLLALPGIRERYPDVKLFVAGDNLTRYSTWKEKIKISAYGKYLREIIEEHQLWEQVEFLGRLDAEEMKKAYLGANLFVCCSSVENSPNSLGEAMLLGVPCVCADVGGIPSLFENGVDGILYRGNAEGHIVGEPEKEEARDRGTELDRVVSSLREAVLKMFGDEKKASEYGKNARKHAQRTHDREKNYHRLLEIYRDIMGKTM